MNKGIDSLQGIFAKRLKATRLKQNYSQEELADLAGYHRTYIGSVERGERNITLSTLETIASALKVDPLQLLQEEGK